VSARAVPADQEVPPDVSLVERGLVGAGARHRRRTCCLAFELFRLFATPKTKMHDRPVVRPTSDEKEVSMVEEPVLTPNAYRPKSSCRQSMGFAAERRA
jgi:hypothetical protein